MNRREKVLTWSFIALLPLYWIGSEVWYAASRNPRGVSTISEYVLKFGEPASVYPLTLDGRIFYEVRGDLPPFYVAAFPSDPPSYIFEESGRLVDWCSDPGDTPSFHRRWPLDRSESLDLPTFRRRFAR